MEAFVAGEADLLASTSIIEAGLDIPRVNTLVVDRADRFGLASLYQLRGRVGRSNVKAYAYFLHPPDRPLHPAARRRLEALAVHTALGSGFAVALRDLEIRGAGNVLGPEQAGEVRSVGIDLYSRLLARAVAELRGETLDASAPPRVDLAVEAYLPAAWIGDERLAADLYRDLADARSVADVEARRRAWRDRFGPVPPPAEGVLALATLRAYADLDGVASIREAGEAIEVVWRRPPPRTEIEEALAAMPFLAGRLRGRDEAAAARLEVRGADRAAKIEVLRRIVRR
jgi:transcription-repair coupling factor (superfamily II helicase)